VCVCVFYLPLLTRSTHSDPSSAVAFSDVLYDNQAFVQALYQALSWDGILVAQVGEQDSLKEPPAPYSKRRVELAFVDHLKRQGFSAMKHYEEMHGGFMGVWRFMVCFKDIDNVPNWYANQAEVDAALQYRIIRQDDGSWPLHFFDGATMQQYQYPSRIEETLFCRDDANDDMCQAGRGLDPEIVNYPSSQLQVQASTIPNAGRGVFLTEPGTKGMYIAADQLVHSISVMPRSWFLIEALQKDHAFTSVFRTYLYGYGFAHQYFGATGYAVEPSILTFTNHGCNHTYTQGLRMSVNEMTANTSEPPVEWESMHSEHAFLNPFADRNNFLYMHVHEFLLRDMAAGEELLDNYLNFYTPESWEAGLKDLRAQCSQQGEGTIHRYENNQQQQQQPKDTKDEL